MILFSHSGTVIQRSRYMQHVTAHHAFRAAMKLTAYVDRAAPTNLMFSKILSLDDFEILSFFLFQITLTNFAAVVHEAVGSTAKMGKYLSFSCNQ